MKIQAVLPEAHLPAVLERLSLIGVDDIVVSSVRVYAKTDEVRSFRGVRYASQLVDRCALECWPDDDHAEAVARAILQALEKSAADAMIYVSLTEELGSEE
ncbi:MAG TPA: P-II family nitrogen regulator [Polyangiaceae bacterium]|jgi:nitrogen regulatory protein PII|nr:P-II family nitrogen regulator [Polyangiaceae bacterium]